MSYSTRFRQFVVLHAVGIRVKVYIKVSVSNNFYPPVFPSNGTPLKRSTIVVASCRVSTSSSKLYKIESKGVVFPFH